MRVYTSVWLQIVYKKSFVYKPFKDACCLLLHLLCIVRVEILRDCCVGVPETGGNVNRLRTLILSRTVGKPTGVPHKIFGSMINVTETL